MMTRRGYWCENAIAAFDKGGTVNGTKVPAHVAPVNIGAGDQYLLRGINLNLPLIMVYLSQIHSPEKVDGMIDISKGTVRVVVSVFE